MAATANLAPKFLWDHDVPNTPFWSDIEYTTARNFFQCFTEADLQRFKFNNALSVEEKLDWLERILDETLEIREYTSRPQSLHRADYQLWMKLKLARSSIAKNLEKWEEQERIVREMYANGPYDPVSGAKTKNMSALLNLSQILEHNGLHPEAESAAREVLPWLQGHKMLGADAPQVLSYMRMIARSTGKQSQWSESDIWVGKVRELIHGMGGGKFAKYQDDESKGLEELREELRVWKSEHGI
ncbi:uncharacterized protein BDZ99DRAFT_146613 [Mytilinidion resinicola]|uniref:Uncharacterized protein n=1 Tax=Mytilinidion resinicola TaxID=574789 RepID=A0A6A6Y8P7_9PEZI|nr:uncharacterized protein BDZ99DRAFT_146613 [Mytilinidion resinicola]KAF2804989.1 hypothetical protein BDZ99DRAFT_146613 [Mytilinidion resinicola]